MRVFCTHRYTTQQGGDGGRKPGEMSVLPFFLGTLYQRAIRCVSDGRGLHRGTLSAHWCSASKLGIGTTGPGVLIVGGSPGLAVADEPDKRLLVGLAIPVMLLERARTNR